MINRRCLPESQNAVVYLHSLTLRRCLTCFILGSEYSNPHSAGEAEAAIDNGTASDHYERVIRPSAGATSSATATAAFPAKAASTGLEGYGGNAAGAAAAAAAAVKPMPLAPGSAATVKPTAHAAADRAPGGAQATTVLATGRPSLAKEVAAGGFSITNEFPGSVVWASRDGGECRCCVVFSCTFPLGISGQVFCNGGGLHRLCVNGNLVIFARYSPRRSLSLLPFDSQAVYKSVHKRLYPNSIVSAFASSVTGIHSSSARTWHGFNGFIPIHGSWSVFGSRSEFAFSETWKHPHTRCGPVIEDRAQNTCTIIRPEILISRNPYRTAAVTVLRLRVGNRSCAWLLVYLCFHAYIR